MAQLLEKIERSNDRPGDPRNNEVVFPAPDMQDGNLATPINASKLVKAYFKLLPVYRSGLTPLRRGLEVGLFHGYWLVNPFAKFNPLRYTEVGTLVAFLSTIGLLFICSGAIWLYAASNPPTPLSTFTTPEVPADLRTPKGWTQYGTGFFIGGSLSAFVGYLVLANFDVFGNFRALINLLF